MAYKNPTKEEHGRVFAWILPKNYRWSRIFKSFAVLYAIAILPIYALGLDQIFFTKITYYIWKSTIFGVFSKNLPYSCAYGDEYLPCEYNWGWFDQEGRFFLKPEFSYSFLLLLVGGVISLRLICWVISSLENALGVDLVSRILNKFLPGNDQTIREKQGAEGSSADEAK